MMQNLEFVQAQLQDVASTFADDEQADKVGTTRGAQIRLRSLSASGCHWYASSSPNTFRRQDV